MSEILKDFAMNNPLETNQPKAASSRLGEVLAEFHATQGMMVSPTGIALTYNVPKAELDRVMNNKKNMYNLLQKLEGIDFEHTATVLSLVARNITEPKDKARVTDQAMRIAALHKAIK